MSSFRPENHSVWKNTHMCSSTNENMRQFTCIDSVKSKNSGHVSQKLIHTVSTWVCSSTPWDATWHQHGQIHAEKPTFMSNRLQYMDIIILPKNETKLLPGHIQAERQHFWATERNTFMLACLWRKQNDRRLGRSTRKNDGFLSNRTLSRMQHDNCLRRSIRESTAFLSNTCTWSHSSASGILHEGCLGKPMRKNTAFLATERSQGCNMITACADPCEKTQHFWATEFDTCTCSYSSGM